MDSHKLTLKLFADESTAARLARDAFVPVFHGWIQNQALSGHLLIDVADYEHVPTGPGTVLVAHEANIHYDHGDGRSGLLYVRKQPFDAADTFRDRLLGLFRAALSAALLAENDPGLAGIRFRTDEIVFRVHDRLAAPNDAATFDRILGELQAVLATIFPGDVAMEHKPDALRMFEVRIRAKNAPPVSDLLARLEPLATAPAR